MDFDVKTGFNSSVHKGRDIPKGTLGNIIRCSGLAKAEFLKYL
ncbi:MAG: hypothetical protein ABIG90_00705 [bacterium]